MIENDQDRGPAIAVTGNVHPLENEKEDIEDIKTKKKTLRKYSKNAETFHLPCGR